MYGDLLIAHEPSSRGTTGDFPRERERTLCSSFERSKGVVAVIARNEALGMMERRECSFVSRDAGILCFGAESCGRISQLKERMEMRLSLGVCFVARLWNKSSSFGAFEYVVCAVWLYLFRISWDLRV